jgi:hypothetical protein
VRVLKGAKKVKCELREANMGVKVDENAPSLFISSTIFAGLETIGGVSWGRGANASLLVKTLVSATCGTTSDIVLT